MSASRGGISIRVAQHLATSPDDRVYRRALRALLPPGEARALPGGGYRNEISKRLQDVLRVFEREGWVARDEESVVIVDRAALWLYANDEAARRAVNV